MASAVEKLVWDHEILGRLSSLYRNSMRATVVLTFGTFDIVHPGHLLYLERARSFGQALMVGITSDEAVRAVKGAGRPVNTAYNRAFIIAGFSCVDWVFVFDSDDCTMIRLIRPDVCVYSETSEKKLTDRECELALLASYGGRIEYLPAQAQTHTSDIIRRLYQRA